MDNLSYRMNRGCLFLPVAGYQKFIGRSGSVRPLKDKSEREA